MKMSKRNREKILNYVYRKSDSGELSVAQPEALIKKKSGFDICYGRILR